jgi:hypothetical protein
MKDMKSMKNGEIKPQRARRRTKDKQLISHKERQDTENGGKRRN